MNDLKIEEVEKVAALSALGLSSQEIKNFQQKLGSIVDYISQLNEVNTENVNAYYPLDKAEAFREDEVVQELSAEELLANAPDKEGGNFKIPKVL